MIEKDISFGGQTLTIRCPRQTVDIIDFIFCDFQKGISADAVTVIEVIHDKKRDLFSVVESGETIGSDFDQTDLALFLLTRTTYSLVHGISGGMALHGAAVQRDGNGVLIPGNSGTGKSTLTTWLLSRGYNYLTDELTYFPEGADHVNALTRPLYIRQAGLPAIEGFAPLQRREDLVLQNSSGTLFSHRIFAGEAEPGYNHSLPSLLLFIEHNNNEYLSIDAISAAQAAQRLMNCLVNGRNLKLHGFPQVASLAREIPALVLRYSNLIQLDEILEPIIDLVLDIGCSPSSLQKFIKAFNQLKLEQLPASIEIQSSEPAFPLQEMTPKGKKKKLTIGMATYDDFDGVYFSVQALRMYHPEIVEQSEILIIDNHPNGPCAESLKKLDQWIDGYRYLPLQDRQGTAVRDFIFHHAVGEYVLCIDCHVFMVPGAIKKLLDYFEADPDCRDLLQGPMFNDDLKKVSTHFDPVWRKGMYGIWGQDPRGEDPEGEPFEIVMQGLGLFACRKDVWPGFNPQFRGFGGEEGYIHEKFRQMGGKTLCLPFLRWMHRFARPMGVPYPIKWKDRIRNYMIGFNELRLQTKPVKEHFNELLGEEIAQGIFAEIEKETLTSVTSAQVRPSTQESEERREIISSGINTPEEINTERKRVQNSPATHKLNGKFRCIALICSYNRPYMLRHVVLQLLKQSYSLDIAIYDCSGSSGAIADLLVSESMGSRHIYLLKGENTDLHHNFIKIAEHAIREGRTCGQEYDLFFKIDDDDIYFSEYVSDAVDHIRESGVDISTCAADRYLNRDICQSIKNLGSFSEEDDVSFAMPPTMVFNQRALQVLFQRSPDYPIDAVSWGSDRIWRQWWLEAGLKAEIRLSNQFWYHIHGGNVSTGHFFKT